MAGATGRHKQPDPGSLFVPTGLKLHSTIQRWRKPGDTSKRDSAKASAWPKNPLCPHGPEIPLPQLRDTHGPQSGETPSPIGSTNRELWEPQQHQMNQTNENNIAKALKIKLSLKPQPTNFAQDLHAKPKHSECLLKLN